MYCLSRERALFPPVLRDLKHTQETLRSVPAQCSPLTPSFPRHSAGSFPVLPFEQSTVQQPVAHPHSGLSQFQVRLRTRAGLSDRALCSGSLPHSEDTFFQLLPPSHPTPAPFHCHLNKQVFPNRKGSHSGFSLTVWKKLSTPYW